MSDKKTIEFQGYSWEYTGGMCVVGVDTSDYDFITFRRKKPDENKMPEIQQYDGVLVRSDTDMFQGIVTCPDQLVVRDVNGRMIIVKENDISIIWHNGFKIWERKA